MRSLAGLKPPTLFQQKNIIIGFASNIALLHSEQQVLAVLSELAVLSAKGLRRNQPSTNYFVKLTMLQITGPRTIVKF